MFTWHGLALPIDKMMLTHSGLATGVSYFPQRALKHFAFVTPLAEVQRQEQVCSISPGKKSTCCWVMAPRMSCRELLHRDLRARTVCIKPDTRLVFSPRYFCRQCRFDSMTLPITQLERDATLQLGTASSIQL